MSHGYVVKRLDTNHLYGGADPEFGTVWVENWNDAKVIPADELTAARIEALNKEAGGAIELKRVDP